MILCSVGDQASCAKSWISHWLLCTKEPYFIGPTSILYIPSSRIPLAKKNYVTEKKDLYFFKTLCIYAAYNFIRINCNGPSMVLHVSHISLLEVGMSYLDWFRIFMPCFQFKSTWTSHGSFDISLLEVGTVFLVWIRFSL